MTNDETHVSGNGSRRLRGLGCAGTLAIANLAMMSFVAYTFATMTYSNPEQERWYRVGSLIFLVLGAILPIFWLLLIGCGYWGNVKAIIAWMFATMLAFMGYVLMSGGGM